MFDGIFNILYNLISGLVHGSVNLIGSVVTDYQNGDGLQTIINFKLLSDTPIFTIELYDLLLIVFTIFYSMFFIILLYKATKKFITTVFGVFKL